MNSIPFSIPQDGTNQNSDWSVTDLLAYADAVSAQEDARRAAFTSNRLPDHERDMKELQCTVAQRRAAEGLQPRVDPVPLADVVTVEHAEVEHAQNTGDFSLGLSCYSRIAFTTLKSVLPSGEKRPKLYAASRMFDAMQHRARAQNGNAVFTATEAGQYAASLGISWRKVRDGLKAGIGVFWDVQIDPHDARRKIYHMRSKTRVCVALGIDGPGPRVDLPKIAYQGSSEHYKAHVYSAFFEGNRGDYARSTLEKLTGASRPTLQLWERLAGMPVDERYISAPMPTNEAESAELEHNQGERYFLEVEGWKTRRGMHIPATICTCGLLDNDNDFRPDHDVQAQHAEREAARPGRTLHDVWQDTNQYQSGNTRVSAHGRSKHIKNEIKGLTEEHVTKSTAPRSYTARGQRGSSRDRYAQPRRVENMVEAAQYQIKHPFDPVLVNAGSLWRLRYSQAARLFDGSERQIRQLRLGIA